MTPTVRIGLADQLADLEVDPITVDDAAPSGLEYLANGTAMTEAGASVLPSWCCSCCICCCCCG